MTNGSGVYGAMIAEHMLACILSLCRQLPHYAALQRQRLWIPAGRSPPWRGRTVLILGAGTSAAPWPGGSGALTAGFSASAAVPGPSRALNAVYGPEDLDRLLPQADVAACVLPGTRETAGLLHRERLLSMKPGAILVNCGRGSLLDTAALAEALDAVPLLGCALDVTDPEPLPPESPLWARENVILTPMSPEPASATWPRPRTRSTGWPPKISAGIWTANRC